MLRLTFRRFVGAVVIAVACGGSVMMVMRAREHDRILLDLTALQVEVTALQGRIARIELDEQQRVGALERAVFGTTPAPPVVVNTGPEQWQRNRDREIVQRLSALETWRVRVATRLDQMK